MSLSPRKRKRPSIDDIEDDGSSAPLSKRVKTAEREDAPADADDTTAALKRAIESARRVLHPSKPPEKIMCRQEEEEFLRSFFDSCMTSGRGNSLYISGNPGTGKTALLHHILNTLPKSTRTCSKKIGFVSTISCMSSQASSLHEFCKEIIASGKSIVADDDADEFGSVTQYSIDWLQSWITNRKDFIVILLDEMDQLVLSTNEKKELVYRLFEWAKSPTSSLIVIGIANTLDLPDRLLPQLSLKKMEPTVLQFKAYTQEQLLELVNQRLSTVGMPLFDTKALEFLARKVAETAFGDARKMLHVCWHAVDHLSTKLGKSDAKSQMITVADMATIIQKNFDTSNTLGKSVTQVLKALPLHQQLLVVAAYVCCCADKSNNETRRTKLGTILTQYKRMCQQARLDPTPESKLFGYCDILSSYNIIQLSATKRGLASANPSAMKQRVVTFMVRENDVISAFKDNRIASEWLPNKDS